MTGQEIRDWLDKRPFHPFSIKMDNGDELDVRHPKLTFISETGAMYIFETSADPVADVARSQTICELRNISTLRPIVTTTSS